MHKINCIPQIKLIILIFKNIINIFYIKNYALSKKFCKINWKIYKNNYFNIIINVSIYNYIKTNI